MNNLPTDIPAYHKKKPSNISFSSAKSKHKHTYSNCLLLCAGNYYYAKYCTICGKIYDWQRPVEKGNIGYRMLNNDEILERYPDLDIYEIKDIFQKYIKE